MASLYGCDVHVLFVVLPGYEANYSADVFFSRVENSIANQSTLINYTLVMDNAHFGLVSTVSLSLVSTPRVENIFRLSNGALSRTYSFGDIGLQVVGPVAIIRDSVIIYNDPRQPLVPETFSFLLGAAIVGVTTSSQLVVTQRGSRAVVEVTAPGNYATNLRYK